MHIYEHKPHYYETDQMGIIHHSNYIRWFEEARSDMLEQMGMGYDKMEAMGIISPVVAIHCEYKSMTRFGETVWIIPKVIEYDGVRLALTYRVEDKATGTLRVEGESRHCFLNAAGRPISLKRKFPEIHELLLQYLEK